MGTPEIIPAATTLLPGSVRLPLRNRVAAVAVRPRRSESTVHDVLPAGSPVARLRTLMRLPHQR